MAGLTYIAPIATNGGAIVCPYIASVNIDSQLNVEAVTRESVAIRNVNKNFDVSSSVLAEAFDCSGWGIDKSVDAATNELKIAGLKVDLSGSTLHSILSGAIGNDDLKGRLNSYLRKEFTDAFALAFPDYKDLNEDPAVAGSKVQASGSDLNAEGDGGSATDGTTAQNGTSPGQTSGAGTADLANQLGASQVQQTSVISYYAFHLDVSGDAAATTMTDNLTQAYLNSLFMQLPYDTLKAKVDASGNPLNRDLPLAEGDSVTFVFDVEVLTTVDANTSNAAGADNSTRAPTGNTATASTNQQSLNMDLGTRRVAFTVIQNAAAPAFPSNPV